MFYFVFVELLTWTIRTISDPGGMEIKFLEYNFRRKKIFLINKTTLYIRKLIYILKKFIRKYIKNKPTVIGVQFIN